MNVKKERNKNVEGRNKKKRRTNKQEEVKISLPLPLLVRWVGGFGWVVWEKERKGEE